MKLYATVTSERAQKEQGGNKYIQANFTSDRKHIISITLNAKDNGDILVWITPRKGQPKVLTTIKGERQKGECAYKSVDGAHCTTHNTTH